MPIDGQPDQKTTSDQEQTIAADAATEVAAGDATEATAALTPEATQVVNTAPPGARPALRRSQDQESLPD